MVGVAGFEPATPASRTSFPSRQPLYFQYFSSAFDHSLRVSFTLFFGGFSGGYRITFFRKPNRLSLVKGGAGQKLTVLPSGEGNTKTTTSCRLAHA
jgi:hypothetical protein